MDKFSDFDIQLSKQECRLLSKTPKSVGRDPKQLASPNLSISIKERKKNLDFIFGRHFDPKPISHFCSVLKQRLPRIDPKASTNAILATLEDMSNEGQLPEVETMEEVNSDYQSIDETESAYV